MIDPRQFWTPIDTNARRFHALRTQSRAPAAHWVRVSPSVRRVELDAKNPVFGLDQEPRGLKDQGRKSASNSRRRKSDNVEIALGQVLD
jgi:hypothetical protein